MFIVWLFTTGNIVFLLVVHSNPYYIFMTRSFIRDPEWGFLSILVKGTSDRFDSNHTDLTWFLPNLIRIILSVSTIKKVSDDPTNHTA